VQALGSAGGQLIAVLGDISPGQARELAAARRGAVAGVALILAEEGHGAQAAQVLAGAGWRVAVVPDAVRLAAAWQELFRGGAGGLAGTAGVITGSGTPAEAGTATGAGTTAGAAAAYGARVPDGTAAGGTGAGGGQDQPGGADRTAAHGQ
jgi:hypothetical protein